MFLAQKIQKTHRPRYRGGEVFRQHPASWVCLLRGLRHGLGPDWCDLWCLPQLRDPPTLPLAPSNDSRV